jgi:hypothetical protein
MGSETSFRRGSGAVMIVRKAMRREVGEAPFSVKMAGPDRSGSLQMPKTTPAAALVKISKMCGALPEAKRELMSSHAAFTVRGRKFAYFLDNHHGDGIMALCFRGAPGEQQTWIELDAKRYYKPAYIGAQGWVALRLDVGAVNWAEVEARILSSYRLAAPKTLVAKLG